MAGYHDAAVTRGRGWLWLVRLQQKPQYNRSVCLRLIDMHNMSHAHVESIDPSVSNQILVREKKAEKKTTERKASAWHEIK